MKFACGDDAGRKRHAGIGMEIETRPVGRGGDRDKAFGDGVGMKKVLLERGRDGDE